MIDYEHFNLFWQGSVDKQWKIEYSGGLIRNRNELFSQSIEITESLCSEQKLRFGCCEASRMKFKVANIFTPLTGEWLTVSVVIGHNEDLPLMIGRYKVISDKPTADRKWRDVIAYDAMDEITSADMAAWYKKILPDKQSTVSMRQFRESFLRHFNLEWVVPRGGLVNDEMVVERTIDPEQISGRDVITAICEINGCFGHIGRDGKFHYIYLPQAIEGLYPANDLYPDRAPEHLAQAKTGHLYPQDPKGISIVKGNYITAHYEDFRTKSITILQIRQEENDIGKVYPEREITEDDNCYIIQDNFLVYGKSDEQLTVIAQNIYSKITDITYRPFDADCRGNPCLEVGDPVRLTTRYELIESYILERTLKGIQALRDSYRANGVERYTEEVNGINKSIIQLKGKTNVLIRTVEETRLEMKDLESGLSNEIKITAGEIRAELNNTKEGLRNEISVTAAGLRGEIMDTKNGLQTQITANASGLSAEISRAQGAEGNLSTRITATADGLTAEITRATQKEGELSNSLKITADGLAAEITRAQGTEGTLSTQITATANGLSSKVSKGDVSSEISQEAGKVSIKSNRFSLESTNCSITEDGTIRAKNAIFSGKIENSGVFLNSHKLVFKHSGTISSASELIYGGGYVNEIEAMRFGGSTVNIGTNTSDLSKRLVGVNVYGENVCIGIPSIASRCEVKMYAGGAAGLRIHLSGSSDDFVEIAKQSGVNCMAPYIGKKFELGTSNSRIACIHVESISHWAAYGRATLGFFNGTPVGKQTVSTISSTSGATSASNATKINEIINALKKYGLL